MERTKRNYLVITGLISAFMLFSAYFTLTNKVAMGLLGFPDYFRIELTIAKIIGAIVILIPQVPARYKEYVFVGFSICLVSASIAHFFSRDAIYKVILPLTELVLLLLAMRYFSKHQAKAAN
ncbi:DoxX family protein [Chitinophaga barathri]|uniref:DoxX family protein n=1 Tax=Chitinophaga barathri TaxID=1647451 RepID=A0A3N4MEE2_9BACT|nr:DoxX family protein [Chitinophaga barathri]RPD42284.1 DoxX family protein [Chitinophaga barathri]